MRLVFAITICLFASSFISCSKGAGNSGSGKEPGTTTPTDPTPTGTNPPVGEIKEEAGFFVEITGEAREQFNMHKGDDTFDEPCKMGDSDKIINCIVDAEEMSFYARPFNLHYHAPPSLCSYVSFMPFYFVNRKTIYQSAPLSILVDKNGKIGTVDAGNDGVADDEIGCYYKGSTPTCCVGNYTETVRVWDGGATPAGWGNPTTTVVNRPVTDCIGGPATKQDQPVDELGIPLATFKWVEKVGTSVEYKIETPSDHLVSPAWITNYYKSSEHSGGVPSAFDHDIGYTKDLGHPYYTVSCLDTAEEVISQINIQFREWNTKAAYEARKTAPTNHDETGFEPTPFGLEPINDFYDWLDFELASVTYPGLNYK